VCRISLGSGFATGMPEMEAHLWLPRGEGHIAQYSEDLSTVKTALVQRRNGSTSMV